MVKKLLIYVLFSTVLILAILVTPVSCGSEVLATTLATLCIIHWSAELSLVTLGGIVGIVTVAWPVLTLYASAQHTSISPTRYLMPTSLSNARSFIGFFLPTLTLTALIVLRRHLSHQKQLR